MKRQTLTINGKTFELFKSKTSESEPIIRGAVYDEIYDVYGRPSELKVNIWHEWCEWCYDLNKNGMPCELWIAGHSCFSFTIDGKVQYNGHVYQLWITRVHNRAYLIA